VPTIKQVAKLAGIAVSTASNALNGKPGVSPRTRQRTFDAARKLGYVPNPIAQDLVKRTTKNIGIVLSGPPSFRFFTNPAFFEVIRSVTVTLNQSGYHAFLNVIATEEEEPEIIPQIARSRLAAAMVLVGTRRNDQELARLLDEVPIPSIVVIRGALDSKAFSVSVDNRKCGYLATQHLLELGHRSIGYVGHLPGVSLADERLEGYRQALEESGVVYDQSLVVPGDFYKESGSVAVRQLLRQSSRRPTAIFAANDLMALGAIEALEQDGFSIPEAISIVGCDDIPNLHLLKVPLSSVSLPFAEIGRLAAEKAIGVLEKDDRLPSQIILQPQLRIRGSAKIPSET
jgi:LacI family transcriptional regulator